MILNPVTTFVFGRAQSRGQNPIMEDFREETVDVIVQDSPRSPSPPFSYTPAPVTKSVLSISTLRRIETTQIGRKFVSPMDLLIEYEDSERTREQYIELRNERSLILNFIDIQESGVQRFGAEIDIVEERLVYVSFPILWSFLVYF